MKRIVLTLSLLAFTLPALAAEGAAATADNPMAGWMPPKVKKEAQDKRRSWRSSPRCRPRRRRATWTPRRRWSTFPVLMVTDDSKGQAMGETWTREKWTQVMEPFYEKAHACRDEDHPQAVGVPDVGLARLGGRRVHHERWREEGLRPQLHPPRPARREVAGQGDGRGRLGRHDGERPGDGVAAGARGRLLHGQRQRRDQRRDRGHLRDRLRQHLWPGHRLRGATTGTGSGGPQDTPSSTTK